MSTFNGARFLPIQLDSIRAQTDPDWVLLVRDDGSSDGTKELLRVAADEDPRIQIVEDARGRLGSAESFFVLMELALETMATRFALSDQDDFWRPEKLAELGTALERQQDLSGRPVLVFSDLTWVDAEGRRLQDSHFHAAGLQRALDGAGAWLLAMNAVPGCAMAGNRALLEVAKFRSSGVVHHDWWLALMAAAIGRVEVVVTPLTAYRQHDANAIGAQPFIRSVFAAVNSPLSAVRRAYRLYWEAVGQAQALRRAPVFAELCPEWREWCEFAVTQLGARAAVVRVKAVFGGPVRRLGLARNGLMLIAAALPPPSSAALIE